MMQICPITLREARRFVDLYHRHHRAPQGGKFAIGLQSAGEIIGVVIVGRPVSKVRDDGYTAEVTRCCVRPGYPNGCSMLYGAAWRAARAMGYQRCITYTLAEEAGTSLRAANYRLIGERRGYTWNSPSRPRVDTHPTGQKVLWEID